MIALEGVLQSPVVGFGVIISTILPQQCPFMYAIYFRVKKWLGAPAIPKRPTRIICEKPVIE